MLVLVALLIPAVPAQQHSTHIKSMPFFDSQNWFTLVSKSWLVQNQLMLRFLPESKFQKAVQHHGPVPVAIETDQSAIQMYSSGVLIGSCGTNFNHGVPAVGSALSLAPTSGR